MRFLKGSKVWLHSPCTLTRLFTVTVNTKPRYSPQASTKCMCSQISVNMWVEFSAEICNNDPKELIFNHTGLLNKYVCLSNLPVFNRCLLCMLPQHKWMNLTKTFPDYISSQKLMGKKGFCIALLFSDC